MRYKRKALVILSLVALIAICQCTKIGDTENNNGETSPELQTRMKDGKQGLIDQGKEIFRFDAFGDEDFWSGLLHIDKAILGEANGGYGPGVSPNTALAVGLKVDAEALPPEVVAGITSGAISLDDPKSTIALLKLNAVVGVKGNFDQSGTTLQSIGITCASCHSTVDNSFTEGVGKRLDGWPNRDLNVGVIVSLTDNALPIANMLHVPEPTLRSILSLWGPGRYPAILFMDGKAFRPDGKIAANLIPAAFGLKGIELTTYTGWGDISYWNSFVANLEMHGKGNFSDPRLNDPKYPIAVENHFYNVVNNPDLITSKLPALRAYQHSLDAPKPPANSFNQAAAAKGKAIFLTKAKCASCHALPLYADNILHSAAEIGIDDFDAMRSPTGMYRTTPLGGLFAKTKGGFYHDGRFTTLADVVNHYDDHMVLHLMPNEKQNLVEFLKSL
jgi:cytochrome c553